MNFNSAIRGAFCFVSFFYASISYAVVSPNSRGVIYQYPLAGASEVAPGTGIGIRASSAYDAASFSEGSFMAIGSISGSHPLTVHLSRDRRTALFHSATPFAYDEDVHFAMTAKLAGGAIADTFTFTTMRRAPMQTIPDWIRNEVSRSSNDLPKMMSPLDTSYDLFPTLTITVDSGATPGTIYMANEGFTFIPNQFYLFLLDEHGNLTKQKSLVTDYAQDFKLQPTGIRTYYDEFASVFYGVDSSWNIIDTFATLNYTTDSHELRIFPDGSYAMIGLSESNLDMSSNVVGGDTAAIVFGGVIQKFDADKNLLFEWRGIDHFRVEDATFENLTSEIIDFEHANSLDFDSLGNIILSSRHLCEITKINGETGDIIWRFGGHHNQFKLLNDSVRFSYQHAARLLPNGHLIFMDNANFDTLIGGNGNLIEHSHPVEYELDTSAMTARLVWQFHHTPETFTDAMGYVERLPNGNTFIGWGADTLAITELRPDNSTAFEMNMWNGNFSYRAIKYPTDTSLSASVPIIPDESNSPSLSIAEDPMTGITEANITLSVSSNASLKLYDILGRESLSLNDNVLNAGSHVFPIYANGLASGSYYCVLRLDGDQVITKPVQIIK